MARDSAAAYGQIRLDGQETQLAEVTDGSL